MLAWWVDLLRESLGDPRRAGERLLAQGFPDGAALAGLILMAVLSALVVHLSLGLQPPEIREGFVAMLGGPFTSALTQAGLMLTMAGVMYGAGRMMGGRGSFGGAVTLVAWLQAVLLALQLVQIVALFTIPPLAQVFGMVGLFLMGWLLTGFTAALHGFASMLKVFAGVVAVFIATAMVLAVVLVMLVGDRIAAGGL
jgi:hypothetical protein